MMIEIKSRAGGTSRSNGPDGPPGEREEGLRRGAAGIGNVRELFLGIEGRNVTLPSPVPLSGPLEDGMICGPPFPKLMTAR